MKLLLSVVALVALALPAFADNGQIQRDPQRQYRVESSIPRQCFSGKLITAANRAGEQTLYVQTAQGRIYELQLAQGCAALDVAQSLSLRVEGAKAACVGEPAQLVVGTAEGSRRCKVATVRSLTSYQQAALAASQR
jgi:hypothetical protein